MTHAHVTLQKRLERNRIAHYLMLARPHYSSGLVLAVRISRKNYNWLLCMGVKERKLVLGAR